jgi:hypothetical protein
MEPTPESPYWSGLLSPGSPARSRRSTDTQQPPQTLSLVASPRYWVLSHELSLVCHWIGGASNANELNRWTKLLLQLGIGLDGSVEMLWARHRLWNWFGSLPAYELDTFLDKKSEPLPQPASLIHTYISYVYDFFLKIMCIQLNTHESMCARPCLFGSFHVWAGEVSILPRV